MKRLNINILGLGETRWTNCGSFNSDKCAVLYSGGNKHKRGVAFLLEENTAKCIIGYRPVSDRIIVLKLKGKHFNNTIIQVYAPTCTCSSEEIEQFYENLATAKNQCGSLDVRMVMGDLNAKVGRKQAEDDGVVSPLGLGE